MIKANELVEDFTLNDLFKAYFDCRKHKRNTLNALYFELNLETNLLELYRDLKSGKYKIGKSICFVVTVPRPREVWAANFRDRIVHHLIYNFIAKRFYKRFIADTYSCIPKRGTLAAAKRLQHFAASATQNYTKPMYYLKADLANFFVSINKDILFKLIQKQVPEKFLQDIIKQIIYHDPTTNVYKKSSERKFALIPKHKSLFYSNKNNGLPIGNLSSQFFSNVYLDVMDKFIKEQLKCKYYVRYVDDFVIIDESPSNLNEYYNKIQNFIQENLLLSINPRKRMINKVQLGIDFVGFIIKPRRMQLRIKTIRKIFFQIKLWKNNYNPFDELTLIQFLRTINSYLGMLINTAGFNMRFMICNMVKSLFIEPDLCYSKMIIN